MMTVIEAAKLLGMSRRFVYRLCDKGLLDHFRLGNRIRITQEGIQAYLEKRTPQLNVEVSRKKPQLQFLKLKPR